MSNKPTYLQERTRCLQLVQAYREQIEQVVADPKWWGQREEMKLVAKKISNSLRRIEGEIKSPRARKGSDFSIDEIERAMAIIDEQNINPFD